MMYEKRDRSDGNESCDLSPERDGSTLRRSAYHGYKSTGYVPNVDADLSSMNPLVTPGVDMTDRCANRCSFFEANSGRRDQDQRLHKAEPTSDEVVMYRQPDGEEEDNDDSYRENQNEETDLN